MQELTKIQQAFNNISHIKPILLFSGGMDSFIIKHLSAVPDSQCIFVDMGTPENAIEKERLERYFPSILQIPFPLSDFALWNHIIPYRNHMLALLGFQFSSQVIFGFTAGDTTRDKDFVFKAQIEGITSYFGGVPEKVRYPGPYTLMMPFKSFTKSDLVKAYLKKGYTSRDLLTKTTSCYAGSKHIGGCGRCRSCLRKFTALINAESSLGISMRKCTEYDPYDYMVDFYEESKRKSRDIQELKEIEVCLKKM